MKRSMNPIKQGYLGMIFIMIIANIMALLLVSPMQNANLFAFEDPNSMLNIVFFLFLMLVFTAILLLLIKKKAHVIISVILALSIGSVIFYVVRALLHGLIPELAAYAIGIAVGIAGILLLVYYQEWYVINIIGIIASAGCATIFGISVSPLPVIVLLVLLIVYDYISVNKTKHMLTLGDGVLKQKIPIMFIVPKTANYSYRKNKFSMRDPKEERSAYILGMGDVILPSILVISAQVFAAGVCVFGVALPAIGAFAGSVIGLGLLTIPLSSGKPQPGLPIINTCAIVGFLICCLITGSWDWAFAGFW